MGGFVRADCGLTRNVLAGIRLRINQAFGFRFGYRRATIEFEGAIEGAPETTEMSLSGPDVGVLFHS